METRINNIKDLRRALAELKISGNPALWEINFLKNPGESVMVQIEEKDCEFSNAESITIAYNAMVKDIYDEMEKVFGTRNDASASASAATWEAMIKRPDNYVDVELGLTNESNVLSHAHAKIQIADSYGVFRMKRISQFETEKQEILNA